VCSPSGLVSVLIAGLDFSGVERPSFSVLACEQDSTKIFPAIRVLPLAVVCTLGFAIFRSQIFVFGFGSVDQAACFGSHLACKCAPDQRPTQEFFFRFTGLLIGGNPTEFSCLPAKIFVAPIMASVFPFLASRCVNRSVLTPAPARSARQLSRSGPTV
jgi:hypothetical protein